MTLPNPPSVLGPLVSRQAVELAAISVLQTPPRPDSAYPTLVYFLAEAERQYNLPVRSLSPPPSPASFRGGLDLETFQEDQLPMVFVVAQPHGDAQRYDLGSYMQEFEIQVAAVIEGQSEDDARAFADAYGIALTSALLKDGSLNGLAIKTMLTGFPHTEFPNPDVRTIIRTVVTFQSLVPGVVTEGAAPAFGWSLDPYALPSEHGTIEQVDVTIVAEPLT